MNIYLASSWRNQLQPIVQGLLRLAGHEVYDFRNPPGRAGFAWRDIVERSPTGEATPDALAEALRHPDALAGFEADFSAMRWAHACVLVMPCGRSAHLELGWCLGAGKPAVVYQIAPAEPELMYLLAGPTPIVASPEALLAWAALKEGR